jgi:hypothetical protein
MLHDDISMTQNMMLRSTIWMSGAKLTNIEMCVVVAPPVIQQAKGMVEVG